MTHLLIRMRLIIGNPGGHDSTSEIDMMYDSNAWHHAARICMHVPHSERPTMLLCVRVPGLGTPVAQRAQSAWLHGRKKQLTLWSNKKLRSAL